MEWWITQYSEALGEWMLDDFARHAYLNQLKMAIVLSAMSHIIGSAFTRQS